MFAVNRSRTEAVNLEVDLRSFTESWVLEASTLCHDDPTARNVAAAPNRVVPAPLAHASLRDGCLAAVLPAQSWNVLRLTVPE